MLKRKGCEKKQPLGSKICNTCTDVLSYRQGFHAEFQFLMINSSLGSGVIAPGYIDMADVANRGKEQQGFLDGK